MKVLKAYKFKVKKANRKVLDNLDSTLDLCRELYNAGLAERRDAWRLNRITIGYLEQANQLSEIKEVRQDLKNSHSQILQDVLKRLDKTFKAFFSRVKKGVAKVGFPRFQGKNRYDSFTFPQSGFSLTGNKLTLSKIGTLTLRLSRKIVGKVKTLTIKKELNSWFAIFTVEVESESLGKTGQVVGIDIGIKSFAVFDDGQMINNPKFYESTQKQLRRFQRSISRKKKDSQSRRKAVLKLKKLHLRIKNLRHEFLHQETTKLIKKFDVICIEKLNIKGLAKGILAKQVNDASWSKFFNLLNYKAANADKKVVEVKSCGTSQICSNCLIEVPKDLSVRIHHCRNCGLVLDRDTNAAKNILRLGLRLLESTKLAGV